MIEKHEKKTRGTNNNNNNNNNSNNTNKNQTVTMLGCQKLDQKSKKKYKSLDLE